jgi:hypothetical protein
MGAFKDISTKLMLNYGKHTGRLGLNNDELWFLWIYARADYYRITKRKTGPGEKENIDTENTLV